MSDDLSLGQEPTPIRCEGATLPGVFYISRCKGADLVTRTRLAAAATRGCSCSTDHCCADSGSCDCCSYGDFAYDEDGRLRSVSSPPPIIECGENCSCPSTCRNRVVGHGVQQRLTVFRTSDERGWGVRCDEPLRRGTFVCEYAGEIISSIEATSRRHKRMRVADDGFRADGGPMNYILSVLEHTGSGDVLKTTIDPTHRGNVGRYINHACDPTLVPVLVRVGSLVPSVALFCRRDIDAGEELTFHYGDANGDASSTSNEDANAVKKHHSNTLLNKLESMAARRDCRCGSARCEGFLPFDPGAG